MAMSGALPKSKPGPSSTTLDRKEGVVVGADDVPTFTLRPKRDRRVKIAAMAPERERRRAWPN